MSRLRRDGAPFAAPNKTKLNDLSIKRLKGKQGAYLVWDVLQKGLAVNVQASGSKSYKCIYLYPG